MTSLLTVLAFVSRLIPWTQIFAYVAQRLVVHNTALLAKGGITPEQAQDIANKVVEAGVVAGQTLLEHATAKEAGIAPPTNTLPQQALAAWSDGAPTPPAYKAEYRTPVPGLTPIVGDGTPASPRGFATVPGQPVLTQEEVDAQR